MKILIGNASLSKLTKGAKTKGAVYVCRKCGKVYGARSRSKDCKHDFILRNLEGIAREENKLWDSGSCGFSEFVSDPLHDLQIQKLAVLKKTWPEVWLGSFNWNDGRIWKLVKYTGQKIDNFSHDFALPCNDEELFQRLKDYNNPENEELLAKERFDILEKANDRLAELGGVLLYWS